MSRSRRRLALAAALVLVVPLGGLGLTGCSAIQRGLMGALGDPSGTASPTPTAPAPSGGAPSSEAPSPDTPSAPDDGPTAPTTTPAPRSVGWGPAGRVRVGACVQLDDSAPIDGDSAEEVPCTRLHDAQVVGQFRLPDGGYPDEDALAALTEKKCGAAFKTYTGTAYDESLLTSTSWAATPDEYARGQRTLTCLVTMWDGTRFSGDAKGRSDESQFGHAKDWSSPHPEQLYGDEEPSEQAA